MSKKTGGPAFPHSFVAHPTEETFVAKGMTLRDYFAAKALQGIIASEQPGDEEFVTIESYAKDAYRYADAMLKARSK